MHTAGPWQAFLSNFWTVAGEPTPDEGIWHVATEIAPQPRQPGSVVRTFVALVPFYGTEVEANARLIAASPILYEYAKQRAEQGDAEAAQIVGEIDAAIAKATS